MKWERSEVWGVCDFAVFSYSKFTIGKHCKITYPPNFRPLPFHQKSKISRKILNLAKSIYQFRRVKFLGSSEHNCESGAGLSSKTPPSGQFFKNHVHNYIKNKNYYFYIMYYIKNTGFLQAQTSFFGSEKSFENVWLSSFEIWYLRRPTG